VETLLFAGRWLMAPIYVGLLFTLAAIAVKFVEELVITLPSVLSLQERDLVLFVLGLIESGPARQSHADGRLRRL
jgi:uncharacterized protein (TIGR00645 family)